MRARVILLLPIMIVLFYMLPVLRYSLSAEQCDTASCATVTIQESQSPQLVIVTTAPDWNQAITLQIQQAFDILADLRALVIPVAEALTEELSLY